MHRPRRSFAARRSWAERASHRLRDAYQELTHWGVAEALRAAGMRAPSWSTPHVMSNRKPSGPVQRSGQRCSLARARFPDRADAMGGRPSVAVRYRASRVAGTSGSDPNRGASRGRTRRIQGPLRRGNAMCAGIRVVSRRSPSDSWACRTSRPEPNWILRLPTHGELIWTHDWRRWRATQSESGPSTGSRLETPF